MRDYSFGNFLRELRMRRGLSQFQLGMLVGVSDKAVSKWENGSAKPQSRILYGLSEVLGITVDELLACKYHSGGFAMTKALWTKASQALTDLYGDVPPMEAVNRYFTEYEELKSTGQITYFDFLGRLARLSVCGEGHIQVQGGIGASFIAFIMGASEINPLGPHYYCPCCHSFLPVDALLCGWDLPAKKCSCGREMIRDGHKIPFEMLRPMLRKTAHYDISVSGNLYQAAEETIFSYFRENKVVILTKEESGIRTYVVLDAKYPDLKNGQALPLGEYYDRLKGYPAITLIRNEELDSWRKLEEETGTEFEKAPFLDKRVFDAFLGGDTQGIPEFRTEFARTMIEECAPATIHDLLQILGLCHGTGVWERNGQALVRTGRPVGTLIAYRDDVFHYVQEKVRSQNGSGTGFACHVAENTRRGAYARDGIPQEDRQQLLTLGAEEWFIESLEKIRYLFPKAHAIPYVKHALTLMWYKVYHPESFRKIILNGK